MNRGRNRPLRVLQIIAGMNIGGAENVVMTIAQRLDRKKFTAGLCCTKALGVLAERLNIETPDVDVMLARTSRSLLRYAAPLAVHKTIAQFRPDVVHTHGVTALLQTGPLAMTGFLPPWVHTFHFGNYDNLGKSRAYAAEAYLSRFASRLIAVSEAQRASIIRHHHLDGDRIGTIVNGVVPRPTPNRCASSCKRAELGFAPTDIVVGTIAVLNEQKGVAFLLRAIRQLLDAGSPAKFLIVGGGPCEAALRAEAQTLGLGPNVVFTGWRQDAGELLQALDVFVMSSLWEAMPMALLEAMAAKRAIVVTDVGENRRIVEDGECGVVVPPRDAEALAAGMTTLVRDRQLRERLGDAAHLRHHAHYSVDRMVAAYEDLYATVAS
jgi:glycosyltransferase involved in cell wall biosynthesis